MGVKLKDYQMEVLDKIKNGSILCGSTGSGKSITSLGYFHTKFGGTLEPEFTPMNNNEIKDLYIITTAHKRDLHEWEGELAYFLMSPDPTANLYSNKIVIDSWNNIKKYEDVENAFFIFDEQRVIGKGTWVKAFLHISKHNEWILLTATPGDTWEDYIPVFVANGFYRNRTEFLREHAVYNPFVRYSQIDRYLNEKKLLMYRNQILINMDYSNTAQQNHIYLTCRYDISEYKELMKTRFNKEKGEPIENASELCYLLRKIINSDSSRLNDIWHIAREKKKVIIFYNFDYELELLKSIEYGEEFKVSEWNGHKHESIPESDCWVYLVQYASGCEGWNCILTDTIIFYSQNYSYKVMVQAAGRIDRVNTPFKDLYYYHLRSNAPIDLAIKDALNKKKKFNETKFIFS